MNNTFAKYLKQENVKAILTKQCTLIDVPNCVISKQLQKLLSDYIVNIDANILTVHRPAIKLLTTYELNDKRANSIDYIHNKFCQSDNVIITSHIVNCANSIQQQLMDDQLHCASVICENYVDKSMLILQLVDILMKKTIIICSQQADVNILYTIMANYFQNVSVKKQDEVTPLLIVPLCQFNKLSADDLIQYDLAISIDQYLPVDFNYNVHIFTANQFSIQNSIRLQHQRNIQQPDIYKISLQCGYSISKQKRIGTVNCIEYDKLTSNEYFPQQILKYIQQFAQGQYVLAVNDILAACLLQYIPNIIKFSDLFNEKFTTDKKQLILVEFLYIDTQSIYRAFEQFNQITIIRVNHNQQQQFDICLQLQLNVPLDRKQSVAKYKRIK